MGSPKGPKGLPGSFGSNSMTAFVHLPSEVLEQIYKALNITNRLNLRRVSPSTGRCRKEQLMTCSIDLNHLEGHL